MARGGVNVCSDIDQALNQMAEAVNESNKENSDSRISAYIELTDKGKIKWNGPFEELQKLMVKLTGKDISWTSPGRDCKMLSLNEAEVRWYANSKSLTVNGVKKEEIKSQLRVLSNLVNLDKDNIELDDHEAGENSGPHTLQDTVEQTGSSNPELLANIVRNLEEKVNEELNNLRREIQDIKWSVQKGETSREEHNIDDSASDHSLLAIREFLLKENTCLKERNEKLNEELNNYKCITSDLNMRIKELEDQNSSLTTVIKLLNNEQTDNCGKEPWKAVNNKRKSRIDCRINNIHDDVFEVTRLENRYASLTEGVSDPTNQNETLSDDWSQQRRQPRDKQPARDRSQQRQQDRQQQTQLQAEGREQQRQNPRRQYNRPGKKRQTPESQTGEQKRRIDIVGDSLLKGLKGHKMSRTDKVRVTTFSGCSTRDMFDYIKPTINRKPDQLIVHVGTNSLRDSSNPTTCASEIIDLADSIKDALPTTELVLSTLITRSDDKDLERQVREVNKILRQHSGNKCWTILEHPNITKSHLNRSGLHLNRVGTTHLACNFIQCIQHNSK